MEKLLDKLAVNSNRKAQFVTIFTLVLHGVEHQFEGRIDGQIMKEPRGSNGFGYDPIFQPDGHNRTFAEMSVEEKNGMSHRSQALAKMIAYLEKQIH